MFIVFRLPVMTDGLSVLHRANKSFFSFAPFSHVFNFLKICEKRREDDWAGQQLLPLFISNFIK